MKQYITLLNVSIVFIIFSVVLAILVYHEHINGAVVLVVGVIAMAVNGKFNKQNSNKLMRMRLYFQASALVIVVLLVMLTT